MDNNTMDGPTALLAIYNNPAFPAFGKPCDTHLKTDDGTEFKVYSELLSEKSEFLNVLFSIDEEPGQSVVIHGIPSDILERVLIYLYTGDISLCSKNMLHFLVASDYLMIESLLTKCCSFVLNHINPRNCIKILVTAYQIKELDIKNECQRFLLFCFEEAVKLCKKEAYSLPFNSLKYLLSNRSLNVSEERIIWSYIEEWVKKDKTNRMSVVPELLRCLCINEIDEKLASFIVNSPIIRQNEVYKDLEDLQGTHYHLNDREKVEKIMRYRSDLPLFTGNRLPRSLYFVAKCSLQNENIEMFITYDHHLDVWRRLRSRTFIMHTILRVNHRVYMFEAKNRYWRRDICKACIYDILKNKIRPMAIASHTENFPRNIFVLEASGNIYLIQRTFHTPIIFQKYVEETNEWITLRPMPRLVNLRAVLSLNGQIYVLGTDNTMQVYNPSLRSIRRWKTVAPPNLQRCFMGSVVYQGKIFLVGGYLDIDDDNHSRLVEVYDPDWDEWELYPETPFDSDVTNACLAVVKERLFLYRKSQPYSVAYWDGSGEWKLVDDLSPLQHMFLYTFCPIEEEDVVKKIVMANRSVGASRWRKTGLGKAIM